MDPGTMEAEPTRSEEWDEKARIRGSAEHERFVLANAPMVRYLAQRILSRLPASVELSDLVNDGVVGLMEAIERFDPSRGVRFRSFAESRVRGAILDALRARDAAPRSLRRKLRAMDSAASRVEHRLGRAAGEEEIAQEMGVTADVVAGLRRDRDAARPLDDDARSTESLSDAGICSKARDPFEEVAEAELHQRVSDLILEFPPRERMVLSLYYEQGLTLKEIGRVLSVTESRVCQIHTQCLRDLHLELQGAVSAGTGPRTGRRA